LRRVHKDRKNNGTLGRSEKGAPQVLRKAYAGRWGESKMGVEAVGRNFSPSIKKKRRRKKGSRENLWSANQGKKKLGEVKEKGGKEGKTITVRRLL